MSLAPFSDLQHTTQVWVVLASSSHTFLVLIGSPILLPLVLPKFPPPRRVDLLVPPTERKEESTSLPLLFRFSWHYWPALLPYLQRALILTKPLAGISWSRNQVFPVTSGVSCLGGRWRSYAAVGIEGAARSMFLRVNSEHFLSIGLLTISRWCVELCLKGSIPLLYSIWKLHEYLYVA